MQAVDPVAPAAPPERIPSAVLAYVARPEVRARIRAAVLKKIHPSRAGDVESHCTLVLLEAKPPHSEDKLDAWRATIVKRVIARNVKKLIVDMSREKIAEDFDDLADKTAAPADEQNEADDPDITPWLEMQVEKSATDRETLAILRAKAEKKLSYAEAAEAHGMTEAALKKRVARFVAKYEERRKRFLREKERRELLYALWLWGRALLVAAVALVVAWIALHRERPAAPVSPEPAASSAPAPAMPSVNDEKNIAAPPTATPQ